MHKVGLHLLLAASQCATNAASHDTCPSGSGGGGGAGAGDGAVTAGDVAFLARALSAAISGRVSPHAEATVESTEEGNASSGGNGGSGGAVDSGGEGFSWGGGEGSGGEGLWLALPGTLVAAAAVAQPALLGAPYASALAAASRRAVLAALVPSPLCSLLRRRGGGGVCARPSWRWARPLKRRRGSEGALRRKREPHGSIDGDQGIIRGGLGFRGNQNDGDDDEWRGDEEDDDYYYYYYDNDDDDDDDYGDDKDADNQVDVGENDGGNGGGAGVPARFRRLLQRWHLLRAGAIGGGAVSGGKHSIGGLGAVVSALLAGPALPGVKPAERTFASAAATATASSSSSPPPLSLGAALRTIAGGVGGFL